MISFLQHTLCTDQTIYTGTMNDFPVLFFNAKYDQHVLNIDKEDPVDNLSRVANLVPFQVEKIDALSFNLHVDQDGHGVLKDFLNTYRSTVSAGAMTFTKKPHTVSNIWIRLALESTKNQNKINIISDNKCLTATENAKGLKRLSFLECTGESNQVWGPVLKMDVLKKLQGSSEDTTHANNELNSLIKRLDTFAVSRNTY